MSSNEQSMSFDDTFEHLFKVVGSSRFINLEGKRGDVPFYICPFEPAYARELDDRVQTLANRLQSEQGVICKTINIYELCNKILDEQGALEVILEQEKELDKSDLLDSLNGILGAGTELKDAVLAVIEENPEAKVFFMTGVGEVHPYVSIQSLLTKLESSITSLPLIVFFPGLYSENIGSGSSLELFGRLHNRYYRASNILKYGV